MTQQATCRAGHVHDLNRWYVSQGGRIPLSVLDREAGAQMRAEVAASTRRFLMTPDWDDRAQRWP